MAVWSVSPGREGQVDIVIDGHFYAVDKAEANAIAGALIQAYHYPTEPGPRLLENLQDRIGHLETIEGQVATLKRQAGGLMARLSAIENMLPTPAEGASPAILVTAFDNYMSAVRERLSKLEAWQNKVRDR